VFSWQLSKSPLLLGFVVGLIFGSLNLVFTWLYPLDDDSPGALLRFGRCFCMGARVTERRDAAETIVRRDCR
jgi:hypothetical protein